MQVDEKLEDPQEVVLGGIPASFKTYRAAQDIQYTPERSLQEGLNMVKTLKAHINHLELGSKMRKDVWLKEIARYVVPSVRPLCRMLTRTISSLQNQGTPSTLIAVCGGS